MLTREQRVEEALKFAAEHLAERGEEDAAVLQVEWVVVEVMVMVEV